MGEVINFPSDVALGFTPSPRLEALTREARLDSHRGEPVWFESKWRAPEAELSEERIHALAALSTMNEQVARINIRRWLDTGVNNSGHYLMLGIDIGHGAVERHIETLTGNASSLNTVPVYIEGLQPPTSRGFAMLRAALLGFGEESLTKNVSAFDIFFRLPDVIRKSPRA